MSLSGQGQGHEGQHSGWLMSNLGLGSCSEVTYPSLIPFEAWDKVLGGQGQGVPSVPTSAATTLPRRSGLCPEAHLPLRALVWIIYGSGLKALRVTHTDLNPEGTH